MPDPLGLAEGVTLRVAPPLSEWQACTMLSLRDIINDDAPLVVAHADRFVEWGQDLLFRAVALFQAGLFSSGYAAFSLMTSRDS